MAVTVLIGLDMYRGVSYLCTPESQITVGSCENDTILFALYNKN